MRGMLLAMMALAAGSGAPSPPGSRSFSLPPRRDSSECPKCGHSSQKKYCPKCKKRLWPKE